MRNSSHHFALSKFKPQDETEGGYRIVVNKKEFPALQNMAFYKLVLFEKGFREPHWHANADELGYCLKGKVLVTFFGNKNNKQTFVVPAGHTFFIPSGAIHSIENIADENSELILQFSHDMPEDFELTSSFEMFSNSVLEKTWGVEEKHFQHLNRKIKSKRFSKLDEKRVFSREYLYKSPYQFALEDSMPLINNGGGSARVARQNVWAVVQRQALYSLILDEKGMREPHWHPNTKELGYVAKGRAKMSILSPSGMIDTYILEEGDIYFIPEAYPHHIENLSGALLHFLIFFDQPMPEDIGFTASVKSFSDEVLSKSFESPIEIFQKIPTYYEDLFIVDKKHEKKS